MELRQITKNKKGNLGMIVPSVLTLTLAAIILVFGLLILNEIWGQTSSGTEAYRAANQTIVGIGKFADYFDLITLAIVVAVIIGLLLVVFAIRGRKQ